MAAKEKDLHRTEAIDPSAEEKHWRERYQDEPYYESVFSYDEYAPAYRLGVAGRTRYETWEMAEPQLRDEWQRERGTSGLSWEQAQPASRAAWQRVDESLRTSSATARFGEMQSAGSMRDDAGDAGDVIDVLQSLVECSLDGEYGFQACAEQASSAELKSVFTRRADDCRGAAAELNARIRSLGGKPREHGSASGALHRGWVAVKATLGTYDDKAVLEEAERGEDNAKARYAKALKANLPADVKLLVERQMQGVQRNHDQVKALRDQYRTA